MLNKKQVYTNTKFRGHHYAIGGMQAAIVVADTPIEAAALLNLELKDLGLPPSALPEDMVTVQTYQAKAIVLCDGDY